MQRKIIQSLEKWKHKTNRKPLIIQEARQVGKTWVMKHFGEQSFEKVAYINFDNNPRMKTLFSGDYDIYRLMLGLKIESGVDIQAENTLIIFDEVLRLGVAAHGSGGEQRQAGEQHSVDRKSVV